MSGLTDEEFNEICRTRFDFGKYTESCIKYYDDGDFANFDPYTGEKINIPEDVKYLFSLLKTAAKTDLGKNLLSQLNPDTKIKLIVDASVKKEAYGYSSQNHLIAITDIDRNKECNATTFLHELTHEVQKQQNGNSYFLATEQDRFMTNKMMEAEARLNTAIATAELMKQLKTEEEFKGFIYSLGPQQLSDYQLLRQIQLSGASKEETTKQMLQAIYQDKKWSEIYNEQAARAASYKMSEDTYLLKNTKDAATVQTMYMKRLGLQAEDAKYFFDPQFISNYPYGKIKEKTERVVQVDNDYTIKNTYENGELVCQNRYSGDKLLSEERKLGNISIKKSYDDDGKIKLITQEYVDSNNQRHKIFEEEGKEAYKIITDEKGNITKIADLDGKEIADAQQIQDQLLQARKVFNKIASNEEVSNEDLISAYQSVQGNQFRIYDDMYALTKTISLKAKEYEQSQQKNEEIKTMPEVSVKNEQQETPKRSEEIILDEMLRAGKLTKEQEDKILEMAVFIEQKRLKEKEQGINNETSYAEQFIDKIKDSKDFTEKQKDIALNAAIKAENIEKNSDYNKILELRGVAHKTSTPTILNAKTNELSPVLQSKVKNGRE